MQITEAPQDLPELFSASTSPVIELHWALLAASDENRRKAHPLLVDLYEDRSLLNEVTSLWGTEPSCFPELVILAHLANVLTVEVGVALEEINEVAQIAAPLLPLRIETSADRTEMLERLERLRLDGAFRARYLTTLRAVWDQIAEEVGGKGLEAVNTTLSSISPRDDWRSLLRGSCADIEPWIDRTDGWLTPSNPVLVVPAYLSGRALLLDLPGLLLVGIKLRDSEPSRADFDALGRMLKSVADPTRLAILARAASGPVLVGELARALDISQPTVSNHVKLLRSSGVLVERQGERGRRELVIDRGAFEALSGMLVADVLGNSDVPTIK